MTRTPTTNRVGSFLVAVAIAAIAIPPALAGPANDPGVVARKLGSPDPRENVTKTQYLPGAVATQLGSPDPRGTAMDDASQAASGVARKLGSPDPRDTGLASIAPSAVSSDLGSPDPQDAAVVSRTVVEETGRSFDWNDFGIGLGFGIGLSAILAGVIVLAAVAFRGRSVAQPLA